MYNMDISIFGYKLNLEILILIGIIYLILVGHTVCGCCNMHGIMESMTNNTDNTLKKDKMLGTQVGPGSNNVQTNMNNLPSIHPIAAATLNKDLNKEGFVGANTNYGESSQFDLNNDASVNTSSWSMPNLTVVPGQPLSAGVKNILDRKAQPIPLPEGEMLMFANTPFKPECCPNTYSNSSGCACMTTDQYNYLQTRGSNNVPYSEY